MSAIVNPLLGSGTPASSVNIGAPTSTGIVSSAVNAVTGVVSSAASAVVTTSANALEATFFSSRVIAIVLGLLFIGGAILLYIGEDLSGAIEKGKGAIGLAA